MRARRHPFDLTGLPGIVLGAVLLIGGCTTTPLPEEPTAAPLQPKTEASKQALSETLPEKPAVRRWWKTPKTLPVYSLKNTPAPAPAQTYLTRFAATEAEPTVPGQFDAKQQLEMLELPPEGRVKNAEDQVSLWLYAELELPAPRTGIILKTGSAEAAEVYLNGKLVYSGGQTPRPFLADADVVPDLAFQKGTNLLAVHIRSTSQKWRFSLRFFGPDALPLLWSPFLSPEKEK